MQNKLKINKNEILFINPNINCYSDNDPFYILANKFIGYNLLYYTDIIKNTNYNILNDSLFFCLAMNLDIKYNNNYYYSRNKNNYDYIYSEKYIYKNINRKIFKNFKNI